MFCFGRSYLASTRNSPVPTKFLNSPVPSKFLYRSSSKRSRPGSTTRCSPHSDRSCVSAASRAFTRSIHRPHRLHHAILFCAQRLTSPARAAQGYSGLVARDLPFRAIQLPLYEALKQAYAQRFCDGASDQLSPPAAAGLGACAGMTAAAATTPVDVIKTQMMCGSGREGVGAIVRRLVAAEGPKVSAARREPDKPGPVRPRLARRSAHRPRGRRRSSRGCRSAWGSWGARRRSSSSSTSSSGAPSPTASPSTQCRRRPARPCRRNRCVFFTCPAACRRRRAARPAARPAPVSRVRVGLNEF